MNRKQFTGKRRRKRTHAPSRVCRLVSCLLPGLYLVCAEVAQAARYRQRAVTSPGFRTRSRSLLAFASVSHNNRKQVTGFPGAGISIRQTNRRSPKNGANPGVLPMACGVADTEQDGNVAFLGLG